MRERIYEMAAQAVSPAGAEELLLASLCEAAEAELAAKLRRGLAPEDCGTLFTFSAALIASSELLLLRSANSAEQFSAGDVSVRHDRSTLASTAAALRRHAQSLMSPFHADDSFAFLGVRG